MVHHVTDIEHAFCRPEHIAAVYGIKLADAQTMITNVIAANHAVFPAEFAQKRSNLKDTALRKMENVPSALDLLAGGVLFEQVKGKRLLPHVLTALQNEGHNPMRLTETPSAALVHPFLRDLINQLKQTVPVAPHVND